MILALLAFIVPPLLGISILIVLRLFRDFATTALVGSIGGLAIFTVGVYAFDLFLTIHAALIAGLTTTGIILVLIGPRLLKVRWHDFTYDRIAAVVFAGIFILSAVISPKLLIEKPDGSLHTGIINAFGDVAWHTANITLFAAEQSVPPENPIFAGNPLVYPFMVNYLSALLIVGGASLVASVTWPAVWLIPVLVTLLYCFVRVYTGSKRAGVIALLLFLFGGATFGFLRLPTDFKAADTTIINFLTHLPDRDYSGVGTDSVFHFLNPVMTLLLPQRPFLMGMSLAFAILLLLHPREKKPNKEYLVAGVLAGVLPLFHGHTILALIPPIIVLFLLRPNIRSWLLFAAPALAIGLPQMTIYSFGEHTEGAFFRFDPGWMAGEVNRFWYWFQNTGFLIPAVVLGIFLPSAPAKLKGIAGAGMVLFIAANIWLFAPWAWDNFKLIVYFFIFSLPLVAWLADQMLQRSKTVILSVCVWLFLATHMLSAGLDIWKLALPTATVWGEWDARTVAAAKMIERTTNQGDTILTAPIHNSAVALAGRPMYLGFAAHVWSHGYEPWTREHAIEPFYRGTISQLPQQAVQYVLIGPVERSKYSPIVIRPEWKLAGQSSGYALYHIAP